MSIFTTIVSVVLFTLILVIAGVLRFGNGERDIWTGLLLGIGGSSLVWVITIPLLISYIGPQRFVNGTQRLTDGIIRAY